MHDYNTSLCLCSYRDCPRPPAGGANHTLHGLGAADPVGTGAVAPPLGSGEHMDGQPCGGVLQRRHVRSFSNQAFICLRFLDWNCFWIKVLWHSDIFQMLDVVSLKMQNEYCTFCSVDHSHWCCVNNSDHFSQKWAQPDCQGSWVKRSINDV